MALDAYRQKRDFRTTPEPRGKVARRKARSLWFVVQKHAATRLHYDFRLELNGVLLSWAVPKGPSLDPAEKRLAIQVEDHPLEYGGFEGVISSAQYGSGTVMVWDRGTWVPKEDAVSGYAEGVLKFELHGEKLKGGWTLVRTRGSKYGGKSGKQAWLLIKEKDEFARHEADAHVVDNAPNSVLSGRTIEEIARDRDRVWESNKSADARVRVDKATRTSPVRQDDYADPAEADGAEHAAAAKKPSSRKPSVPAGTRNASAAPASVAGVALSHADKLLYPDAKISKLDLARYYEAIGDWIVPHLKGRPLSLVRCPDGWKAECFYQKHAEKSVSQAVGRVSVPESGGHAMYLMADSVPALVGLVQWGVLELHPWGSRQPKLDRPDRLIFDLDPDEGVDWSQITEAVGLLRTLLDEMGLVGFLKTTGGKGLHVVTPIRPTLDWERAKGFTKAVAELLTATFPDRFTATLSKSRRKGKIFVDYLRNTEGATAVCAYSPRARANAPVATPIAWEELREDVRFDHFNLRNVPKRVSGLRSDPWREFFALRQTVTAAMLKRVGAPNK